MKYKHGSYNLAMARQLRDIPKVYDNTTGEVIAVADAKDLNITQGELLYGPTFESPSLRRLRSPAKETTKQLTVQKVWQKTLRDHIRIYQDGLVRLDGCLGHNVTFALLKVSEDKIRSIRKPNGQLKADFIRKLAKFMTKNRPKSNLNNAQLILYGITQLLSENTS